MNGGLLLGSVTAPWAGRMTPAQPSQVHQDEMPALGPEHLAEFWTQDLWALHAVTWWWRHWERTGLVDVRTADTMSDGWKLWSAWQPQVAPNNIAEIATLAADAAAT